MPIYTKVWAQFIAEIAFMVLWSARDSVCKASIEPALILQSGKD